MKYTVWSRWYEWVHSIGGQVAIGLESGVGVSKYADAKYGYLQMWEIRLGLEDGVAVSVYADEGYDWIYMEQIRKRLEQEKGL